MIFQRLLRRGPEYFSWCLAAWTCTSAAKKACATQPGRTLACLPAVPIDIYTDRAAGYTKVLVAYGQPQDSCMTDSDCAAGNMCYIDQFPGVCQPIAQGGRC